MKRKYLYFESDGLARPTGIILKIWKVEDYRTIGRKSLTRNFVILPVKLLEVGTGTTDTVTQLLVCLYVRSCT